MPDERISRDSWGASWRRYLVRVRCAGSAGVSRGEAAILLKRRQNYENLTKHDARSSGRCTLRAMIKKLVSAVLMAWALSQMANAMGPMGDLSHRHFYKDQEWIWQSEQSRPKVGADGNAIGQPAPSAASHSPVAFFVPTGPGESVSAGSFLTFFVPHNPSPSVAFFVPTQPQKGVSAGSFLTFFVPRNPSPSVAFFVPTQPQKGVSAGSFLAFFVPRNPSPSVAFFVPTQPQKGVSAGSFLAFFVPHNPSAV